MSSNSWVTVDFFLLQGKKIEQSPSSWNSSQFNNWADNYYSHRFDFKKNFVPFCNSGCGVENWTNYKNSLIFLTTTLVCKNKKGKNIQILTNFLNTFEFDELIWWRITFSFSSSTFCHIYSCLSSTSLKLNIQYLH